MTIGQRVLANPLKLVQIRLFLLILFFRLHFYLYLLPCTVNFFYYICEVIHVPEFAGSDFIMAIPIYLTESST